MGTIWVNDLSLGKLPEGPQDWVGHLVKRQHYLYRTGNPCGIHQIFQPVGAKVKTNQQEETMMLYVSNQ